MKGFFQKVTDEINITTLDLLSSATDYIKAVYTVTEEDLSNETIKGITQTSSLSNNQQSWNNNQQSWDQQDNLPPEVLKYSKLHLLNVPKFYKNMSILINGESLNDPENYSLKKAGTYYVEFRLKEGFQFSDSLAGMFKGTCLQYLDLSHCNMEKVSDLSEFCADCSKLRNVNFKYCNFQSVNSMEKMFCGCKSLEAFCFKDIDTSNVKMMNDMFSNCTSLKSVDVINMKKTSLIFEQGIFEGCSLLNNDEVIEFNQVEHENEDYNYLDY